MVCTWSEIGRSIGGNASTKRSLGDHPRDERGLTRPGARASPERSRSVRSPAESDIRGRAQQSGRLGLQGFGATSDIDPLSVMAMSPTRSASGLCGATPDSPLLQTPHRAADVAVSVDGCSCVQQNQVKEQPVTDLPLPPSGYHGLAWLPGGTLVIADPGGSRKTLHRDSCSWTNLGAVITAL
jgi:hypothetical protein